MGTRNWKLEITMILKRLLLQNFRSYDSADFSFSSSITFIVGPNTAGKSNIIESISLLSLGKSKRADHYEQLIKIDEDISRVKGSIESEDNEKRELEVTLAKGEKWGKNGVIKKYLLNGLPKRRTDFAGILPTLLFEPSELDLISGSPGLRRDLMDEVLEQTDRQYRRDMLTYTKALRQRNALLQRARESGVRVEKQFNYWDEVVIRTGTTITEKRRQFIEFLNNSEKKLFLLYITYDPSVISADRLLQYREAEIGAGVTLVGPHRDDVIFSMKRENEIELPLKAYGSRGQQRLGVLQLKLLQLEYMREILSEPPVLLLDDIFSELDDEHIKHLLGVIGKQQTIITTTHKEFIQQIGLNTTNLIELNAV